MRYMWFVVSEVAAYAVGAVMLLVLAAAAVVLLACAVAGVSATYLREEAGYLWRRLRGEPEPVR
jgi:hypothetical protein